MGQFLKWKLEKISLTLKSQIQKWLNKWQWLAKNVKTLHEREYSVDQKEQERVVIKMT